MGFRTAQPAQDDPGERLVDAIVELETQRYLVEVKMAETSVNKLLAEEMAARDWRVRDLAEHLNVRFGVVSRWVSSDEKKRVVPAPLMCFKIAKVFNLDPILVFRKAGYWPVEDLPQHAHQEEIEGLLRLLARILRRVPEDEWDLASAVARTHLDSLQILLNRISENL